MFEAYCAPKKNEIYERYLFNSITQKEGQLFNAFVTELKKSIRTTYEMVRDRIVFGIYDKSTQEKLLREPDLTLEKTTNVCRSIEVSNTLAKVLHNEVGVSAIYKTGRTITTCN